MLVCASLIEIVVAGAAQISAPLLLKLLLRALKNVEMSLFLYTQSHAHTQTRTHIPSALSLSLDLFLSTYLYHSTKEELQKCFFPTQLQVGLLYNPFSPIRRRLGPLPFENIKK